MMDYLVAVVMASGLMLFTTLIKRQLGKAARRSAWYRLSG